MDHKFFKISDTVDLKLAYSDGIRNEVLFFFMSASSFSGTTGVWPMASFTTVGNFTGCAVPSINPFCSGHSSRWFFREL